MLKPLEEAHDWAESAICEAANAGPLDHLNITEMSLMAIACALIDIAEKLS